MGLFKDKDLKNLENSILAAKVMFKMGTSGAIKPEKLPALVVKSGNDILPNAQRLSAKGKRAEAIEALRTQRLEGADGFSVNFNDLMEQVIEKL